MKDRPTHHHPDCGCDKCFFLAIIERQEKEINRLDALLDMINRQGFKGL